MGYYVVIMNNEQYEFVTMNGKIREYPSENDALASYKRTIEKHGSDNVMLLESIGIYIKTDVTIRKNGYSYTM